MRDILSNILYGLFVLIRYSIPAIIGGLLFGLLGAYKPIALNILIGLISILVILYTIGYFYKESK